MVATSTAVDVVGADAVVALVESAPSVDDEQAAATSMSNTAGKIKRLIP
jgi:hypothetical protein